MKRIVGVNYENGEVIGVNVDGLDDKTDSDYFKRVYLASWIEDYPFLICTRCEAEIDMNNSLGTPNHINYCPCCGATMVKRGVDMCIDAKETKRIADNAVIKQSDLIINDIDNKVLCAAKEGRYRETFEFSYPIRFRWEFVKKYLTDKGYQISVDMNDDIFRFSVLWYE